MRNSSCSHTPETSREHVAAVCLLEQVKKHCPDFVIPMLKVIPLRADSPYLNLHCRYPSHFAIDFLHQHPPNLIKEL